MKFKLIYRTLAEWGRSLASFGKKGAEWVKASKIWSKGGLAKLKKVGVGSALAWGLDALFLWDLIHGEVDSAESAENAFFSFYEAATPNELREILASDVNDQEQVAGALAALAQRLSQSSADATGIRVAAYLCAAELVMKNQSGSNIQVGDDDLEALAEYTHDFVMAKMESAGLETSAVPSKDDYLASYSQISGDTLFAVSVVLFAAVVQTLAQAEMYGPTGLGDLSGIENQDRSGGSKIQLPKGPVNATLWD